MMEPRFDNPILQEASDNVLSDPKEALRLCDKFLSHNAINRDCSRIQFDAHEQLGNWEQALSKADEIIQSSSNARMGYFDRARANYYLGNYKNAISDAHQAIKLDKNSVLGSLGHRMMAMSYAAMGDVENSLKTCHAIPELEPGQWFPPIDPLPAGTKAQFTATMERMAHHIRARNQT